MGLFLGMGSALMGLFFLIRLLPRLVGLSLWAASTGITGGMALALLYLMAHR